MEKRTLGNAAKGTALEVSAIGVGCMGFSHAMGAPTDLDEAARVLRAAAEMGYTLFDTAKNYGFKADPCHNEKILGRAFKGMRDQVVIASKTGVEFDYAVDPDQPPLIYDSSRASIRASIEGTLKRLGTDYLDLYFQARIDPRVEPEEVADTMAELMREGKILHWGVSEAPVTYLERAHAVCPLTAVENVYSMVNRKHEHTVPFLEREGIGWVAHGPISKGLLSGTFAQGASFARDDWRSRLVNDGNIERYQELTAYLAELGAAHEASAGQISLAWVLAQKPWIVPIPGMRSPARLQENAAALEVKLTTQELERIEALVAAAGVLS